MNKEAKRGKEAVIIFDLRDLKANSYSHADTRSTSVLHSLSNIEKKPAFNESLWIICKNSNSSNELIPLPFIIANKISKNSGWHLKNIFCIYKEDGKIEGKPLESSYQVLLFFVKDRLYHFDKDPVRLPYVYKGKEWGKRENGSSGYHEGKSGIRYGTKGRDPGNVLYFETRDETGQLTKISEYSDDQLFEFILKISTLPTWTVYTNKRELESVITKMNREYGFVDVYADT